MEGAAHVAARGAAEAMAKLVAGRVVAAWVWENLGQATTARVAKDKMGELVEGSEVGSAE